MDKIFELFNKHSKEIEFSGGYNGSVLLYDGFIKAITEALAERDARIAERDARIKELEAELSRIKEGAEKLPVTPVKRTASFESVDVVSTIDMIQKSDLDRLMKGGE